MNSWSMQEHPELSVWSFDLTILSLVPSLKSVAGHTTDHTCVKLCMFWILKLPCGFQSMHWQHSKHRLDEEIYDGCDKYARNMCDIELLKPHPNCRVWWSNVVVVRRLDILFLSDTCKTLPAGHEEAKHQSDSFSRTTQTPVHCISHSPTHISLLRSSVTHS